MRQEVTHIYNACSVIQKFVMSRVLCHHYLTLSWINFRWEKSRDKNARKWRDETRRIMPREMYDAKLYPVRVQDSEWCWNDSDRTFFTLEHLCFYHSLSLRRLPSLVYACRSDITSIKANVINIYKKMFLLHCEPTQGIPIIWMTWRNQEKQFFVLPWQEKSLHARFSSSGPGQGFPPLEGAGLSQRRLLDCLPPPQVLLHTVQSVHLDQPPSTWQVQKQEEKEEEKKHR